MSQIITEIFFDDYILNNSQKDLTSFQTLLRDIIYQPLAQCGKMTQLVLTNNGKYQTQMKNS